MTTTQSTNNNRTAELVARHRRHASQARRLAAGGPTKRPQLRADQLAWNERRVLEVEAIIAKVDAEVAGLVANERKLTDRMTEARRNGYARPELAARLRRVRAAIKAAA